MHRERPLPRSRDVCAEHARLSGGGALGSARERSNSREKKVGATPGPPAPPHRPRPLRGAAHGQSLAPAQSPGRVADGGHAPPLAGTTPAGTGAVQRRTGGERAHARARARCGSAGGAPARMDRERVSEVAAGCVAVLQPGDDSRARVSVTSNDRAGLLADLTVRKHARREVAAARAGGLGPPLRPHAPTTSPPHLCWAWRGCAPRRAGRGPGPPLAVCLLRPVGPAHAPHVARPAPRPPVPGTATPAAPPRAQDHLRYNGLNILSADISTDPETGLIVDSFQA